MGAIVDLYMIWNEYILNTANKTHYLVFAFATQVIISTDILVIIDYSLFNIVASNGIIAWRSVYVNSILPLEYKIGCLYTRKQIIKIKCILNIKQTYVLNVLFNYKNLRNKS